MKISVIICTWNRAALLRRTLEGLVGLDTPPGVLWELLVVNNNCTDDTDAVIEAFRDRLPIQRVFEPAKGLSHARNHAVRVATGDVLIWTDDDVLVSPGWLIDYHGAFVDRPDIAYFAGPVDPWFESAPPPWMARRLGELSGIVVCVDHGPVERPLLPNEAVFGANMAVRRDVAAAFPFDVTLGRAGATLIGGEDNDFLQRVTNAGHRGLWRPLARVKHFVPRQRMTWDYVSRWYRDAGRTYVRRTKIAPTALVAGVPRWVIREYVQQIAKAWFWTPLKNDRWFNAYRRALMLRGVMEECRLARPVAPAAHP